MGLQSWLCGKVINLFEPEAVELHMSRGYESASSKLLMRWTVVAFDMIGNIRTRPCLGFGAHLYARRLFFLSKDRLKPVHIVVCVRDTATITNTLVPLSMVFPLSVELVYHKQCSHLLVVSNIIVNLGFIY